MKFTSDNTENYNSEFLLSEFTDALSHDTSPGPDDLHYQLLKHLPVSTLLIPLEIFNDIWKTGNIPKSWKEATSVFVVQKLVWVLTWFRKPSVC